MVYTDLSKLNEVETIDLGLETLTNSSSTVSAIVNSPVDTGVGNLWFNMSITVIWLVLIYVFYRREQNIQLDLSRALLTSSGWSFFISTGFLLGGIITTIFPLFWFSCLILISWISVKNLQSKGL